jgi:O-antigen ligase
VPNDLAFLAIIAPLSLALVCLQARSPAATLALVSMALSLCAATLYLSRTATLTFLASTICAAAVLRAGRYVFVILIGVLLAAEIDHLNGYPLLTKFLDVGSRRLDHWAAAWSMFRDAPLLGHGLHTFDDSGIPWAHNLYLQTLAEQGIIGLLALLLLLSYAAGAAWKATRSPVREQRILAAGAVGALVGFCAASVVELTLLREWVVLVMFVLAALAARIPSPTTGPVTKKD